MDIGIIIGIIGFIATLWGSYVTIKNYKGELTFFEIETIPLFDSIVNNINELSIKFNNEPVKSNLVLFEGVIVNSGKRDISKQMIESSVKAKLSDKAKWIAAKIISSSTDLKISLNIIKQNTLEFNFGLLRCDEYIRFQSVIELLSENETGSKKRYKIGELVSFNHRIQDFRKIKKRELENPSSSKKRIKKVIIMSSFAIIITLLFNYLPTIMVKQNFIYENINNQSRIHIFKITNGTVNFGKLNSSDYVNKMPVEMFLLNYKPTKSLYTERYEGVYWLFSVVYISMPLIWLLILILDHLRVKKLRGLIKLN